MFIKDLILLSKKKHLNDQTSSLWSIGGENTYGSIGDNTAISRSSPVQVGTGNDWKEINGGFCQIGVKNDGTLWGWGRNTSYRIGDGTTTDRSSPVQIGSASNWSIPVTAYLNGINGAIKTDGTLWTWGTDDTYNVGTNSQIPVQKSIFTDWTNVSLNLKNGHGIRANGTLWAWGSIQYSGILIPDRPTEISGTDWQNVDGNFGSFVAIKSDGTLWGWGRNTEGQLGLNDIINRSSPVQIGTGSDWSNGVISNRGFQGGTHIIKSNGTLWGWGANVGGSLGDNTIVAKSSPIQIGTGSDWAYIAGTYQSTLAIKTDGTLWAWGSNVYGQLGLGNTTNRSSPIQVGTGSDWRYAKIHDFHSVAIKTDGTLWTWGTVYNNSNGGNNGDGTTISRSSPVQVGTLNTWVSCSIGQFTTYAIKSDGTLWGWGWNYDNSNDALGSGSTFTGYTSPIQINSATNWKDVSCEQNHKFAIKTDGTIWGWGTGTYSALGLGNATSAGSPTQIGTATNWTNISAAYYGGISIKNNKLWIWGNNQYGQTLVNHTLSSTNTISTSPTQIGWDANWKQVINGDNGANNTTLAIKTDGTLWAWGDNQYGQLGDNTVVTRSSPVQIGTDTDWKSTNHISQMTLVTKNNGTLWAWGYSDASSTYLSWLTLEVPHKIGGNKLWSDIEIVPTSVGAGITTDGKLWTWGSEGAFGLFGRGTKNTTAYVPTQVGTGSNWQSLSAESSHIAAIKSDGTLYSWGDNQYGQLGDNTVILRSSPVQIGTGSDWSMVSVGSYTTHAIKTNGTLWGWGNAGGFVGDNTNIARSSPVQIGSSTNWTKISSKRGQVIFALNSSGQLWVWGSDVFGNTGLNSNGITKSSPIQLGSDTWNDVSTSLYNSLMIKSDGTLWSCGYNANGQVGDNTTINRSSPVQIGTDTNWSSVYSGQQISFAKKTDGTLWAWGSNSIRQLGIGDTVSRSSPVQVGTLPTWTKISPGESAVMALKSDNSIWIWGTTGGATLIGYDTTNYPTLHRSSPIQIGEDSWLDITAYNASFIAGIKSDGSLWTKGSTISSIGGQTGQNTTTTVQYLTKVGNLKKWKKLARRVYYVFAAIFDSR